MNSMTDPANNGEQINDSRRACLYPATPICLVDAENFCSTHQGVHPAGRIDDSEVRQFAGRLVELGFAINPDGDPSYLVERINTLLAEGVTPTPPESEWTQPPACPTWCTGKHDDDGQFRDCSSEDAFVPQAGDKVAVVCVETTFNRATGRGTPVRVRLEDSLFNPHHARHLATLLMRAADLIESR